MSATIWRWAQLPDGTTPAEHPPGTRVKSIWQVGPSRAWLLIQVIIDETHTFLDETKGNDPDYLFASEDRCQRGWAGCGRACWCASAGPCG